MRKGDRDRNIQSLTTILHLQKYNGGSVTISHRQAQHSFGSIMSIVQGGTHHLPDQDPKASPI